MDNTLSASEDSGSGIPLLDRWYAGDREALDQLLAQVEPWLHREVSRSMGTAPRAVAESADILQTSILNFLSWGPRFKPQNEAQFRSLLRRIALNELVDQQRKAANRKGRHLESLSRAGQSMSGFNPPARSSQGPSAVVEREEERGWVTLALQFLDPDDRYLVVASEVEGLEWTEIAGELGLPSPDAARVRGSRLKVKIANILRQLKAGYAPPVSD